MRQRKRSTEKRKIRTRSCAPDWRPYNSSYRSNLLITYKRLHVSGKSIRRIVRFRIILYVLLRVFRRFAGQQVEQRSPTARIRPAEKRRKRSRSDFKGHASLACRQLLPKKYYLSAASHRFRLAIWQSVHASVCEITLLNDLIYLDIPYMSVY